MKIKKMLSVVLSSLFIVLIATDPLQAATISTDTEATRTYTTPTYDSDSNSGTTGTISSTASVGSIVEWSTSAASAAGNTSAQTAVSAQYLGAVASNEHTANAMVNWSETYSIGSAGAYTWDFSITDGELSIQDDAYGPSMTAQYSIEIFANGTSVWNSAATLEGGKIGYTLTETGTDIGGTFFGGSGGGVLESNFGFTYGSYMGSAALGTYEAGDTLTLSYILSVGVSGPAYETGATAFFGDPGDLAGSPGMQGSLSSVPIPGALWLLGSGLLGLFGWRRKLIS